MGHLMPDIQDGSLSIWGEPSEELLAREVAVAFGRGAEDREWDVKHGALGELINSTLVEFQRGQKDGWAMTQGSLVAPQRIAKNVDANYFMLLDCDTGEPIDRVHDRLDELGWFAILWTTYSHGKASSEISEAKLIKFCRDNKLTMNDGNRIDIVRQYLTEVTLLHEDIAASITSVTRSHGQGGVKYVASHAPMPRLRIMLLLDEPFHFGDGSHGTQNEAIAAWKEFYRHTAEKLGVAWDQSCIDPSRLMYTPRIAPDADESQHEIRIIDGRPITYEKINTWADNPYLQAADHVGIPKGNQAFKTKNLLKFMKGHADDFEIIEWLEASGAEFLSRGLDKAELECPNSDAHSEQRADDRAFMVSNASAGLAGFHAGCLHNSCKTESGGDRAWWLDRLCEKYGVQDAMELLPWCPNAEQQRNSLDDMLAAMDKNAEDASSEDVTKALMMIIAMNNKGKTIEYTRKLAAASGWTIKDVKELHAEMTKTEEDGEQENARNAPIPDRIEDVVHIYASWAKNVKRRVVKRLIEHRNAAHPVIYNRPEGICVYVKRADGGVTAEEFDVSSNKRWDALMTDLDITFVSVDEGQEFEDADTPKAVLNYLGGAREWNLPILDRVVRVPVFSDGGMLISQNGYNADAEIYFDPPDGVEFYPVPDNPSPDDVALARDLLFDILRDFPFSDCFTGADPLPIRSDELDEDGHPLPNLERGKGSRANALAMIIQPFMREMIHGPCPNYHIDKPERGTGAGYLVDTAWSIFEGSPRAKVQTLSHGDAEIKKAITSTLRSGASIIFLDNIQQKVENADIAAALTAGTWTDRVLGVSQNVSIPIRCTWIMAGNRVPFSEDMMRRNVPIFMDAATANPASDRGKGFYKHDPLHTVLVERRLDHVWACHVLIQHWITSGCPDGSVEMQSFTEWARAVGGVLECAGISGFLSNRAEYMDNRNEDQNTVELVTKRVWKKKHTAKLRPHEIFDALAATGLSAFGNKEETIDPALGLQLGGMNKAGQVRSLGQILSKEYVGKTVKVDDEGTLGSWCKGRDSDGVYYQIKEK